MVRWSRGLGPRGGLTRTEITSEKAVMVTIKEKSLLSTSEWRIALLGGYMRRCRWVIRGEKPGRESPTT